MPKQPANAAALVSVGMPIFNEERFLVESLEAILKQDYPAFEIIIADNASTDDTWKICNRFAADHASIRLVRMPVNVGAAANFQKVLDLAQGEFFMWASGHDLWAPNFISSCVRVLEANPDAVVAFGCSQWVDADGNPMGKASGWTDTRGMSTVARFMSVFWGNMHPILGVMRMRALRRIHRIRKMVGADLIVLSELVLQGDFVHAADTHWSRREFRHERSHDDKLKRYASSEYGLAASGLGRLFPLLQLPVGLARVVIGADIRFADKVFILLLLLPGMPIRYFLGRR